MPGGRGGSKAGWSWRAVAEQSRAGQRSSTDQHRRRPTARVVRRHQLMLKRRQHDGQRVGRRHQLMLKRRQHDHRPRERARDSQRRPSSPGPRSAAPPATTTTAAPPGREKGRRSGRTGAGANALWPFCRRPIAVVRAEVTSDDGGGGSGDHDQPHFSRSCRAPRLSSSEHQPGPCAPSQPPGAAP